MEFLRIPDYAVGNEAARLCLVFRKGSAKGFVNAILRGFQRKRPSLPHGDTPEALGIRFSHPAWLVDRYLQRWDKRHVKEFLERNNELPRSILWVNPFKTSLRELSEALKNDEISCRPITCLPNCLEIEGATFTHHPLYRKGFCFFMDLSSQKVANLVDLSGARFIGDFCAGTGGKSFLLASRKEQNASLVSSDSSHRRLQEMQRRANQYDAGRFMLVQADLTSRPPFTRTFDAILLDVPCSGLGTIRSNPEIRWRIREEDLIDHQLRQSLILKNAFATLKSGGELVYATCSTEPEENEGVVDPFIARNEQAVGVGEPLKTFPCPDSDSGDGFFARRIRRI